MRTRRAPLCSLLTAALLLLVFSQTPPARAQPKRAQPTRPATTARPAAGNPARPAPIPKPSAAERRRLTALYRQAQDHYLNKRYTEALPLFQQVASGLDSPNAWLYVARCHRKLGHPLRAHSAMQRSLARATERAATEPRFAATRDAAQKELNELSRELGHLRVRVTEPPADLVVEANGRRVEPDAATETLLVPGEVTIVATATGHSAVRHRLTIAAGVHELITLRFPKAPQPREPSPKTPAKPKPTPTTKPKPTKPSPGTKPKPDPAPATTRVVQQSGGGVRVTGIVILGFSALGWAAFGIAGVMADRHFQDLQERCNFQRCTDPSLSSDVDLGRILDITANSGLAFGIATTVTGGLMVIFGGPTEVVEEKKPTLSIRPSPGGAWVGLTQRF